MGRSLTSPAFALSRCSASGREIFEHGRATSRRAHHGKVVLAFWTRFGERPLLMAKLEGKNMGSNPHGPCALAANGRPQRMPLGAEPLCQGRIDQVRAWIAAGGLPAA